MIQLEALDKSVKFSFSGSQYYLNDGTIEVPINSLALIDDGSNMVTFKKADSNDVFIQAPLSEFGMTKEELAEFYETNMVGAVGGGESGVTSGDVQSMIDESISRKGRYKRCDRRYSSCCESESLIRRRILKSLLTKRLIVVLPMPLQTQL